MFYIIKFFKILYALIILLLGRLKLIVYRLQYLNRDVKWGMDISVHGNVFFRCKGKVQFGNNIVFTNLTRFNPVGLNKKCSIYVEKGGELIIGANSGFSGVSIVCHRKIEIGEYCNFGGNTFIWDTDFHPLNYMDRRIHDKSKIRSMPIVIGNDVFIGANSTILKGVTIGDRAIIGCGSIVSKDIPSDEVWAGNPIRFIKKIN